MNISYSQAAMKQKARDAMRAKALRASAAQDEDRMTTAEFCCIVIVPAICAALLASPWIVAAVLAIFSR